MFDFIRKPVIWDAWERGIDADIAKTQRFELKSMQDLAIFAQLRHLRSKRIAEVGAGHSRVLPVLAKTNSCVAVERFEGQAGGPSEEREVAGVSNVPAYLGEHDPRLLDGYFDVVFSISVVEHVPLDGLAAFHDDQLRILKPGGLFLHAIDLYLQDEPERAPVRRFEEYRRWVTATEGVAPEGEVYEGPCRFSCDLATNPDDVMYRWGQVAPTLAGTREVAQGVSLIVGGRKLGSDSSSRARASAGRATVPGRRGEPSPGFEAVVVHQMGKVGSRSLYEGLRELDRWPCFHTHMLNRSHPSLRPVDDGSDLRFSGRRDRIPPHVWSAREALSSYLDPGRRWP